jgi:hypothetical protein
MPKKLKVGDPVRDSDDRSVTYYIIAIDDEARTASIKTTRGAVVVHHNVPWSESTVLDASQNPVRVVKKATEKR